MMGLKKLQWINFVVLAIGLLFSWILFWRTFSTENGTLSIATKVWSDFGATIPLIRSFSFGDNYPPQYPIFAGPPIRYHFVFFSLVGLLEKLGVPLSYSLNTLSSLFFISLIYLIYLLSQNLFKSRIVGLLSVILFLFNGSLGFVEFFSKNPLSIHTLSTIITNNTFSSFGPYDGNIVSAFWSLNIFTNQRHLALGYSLVLGSLYLIQKASHNAKILTYKKALLLGIVLGIMPFIHLTAYIMIGVSLLVFFVIDRNLRYKLFVLGVIALTISVPQILSMGHSQIDSLNLLTPGYLISNNLDLFFTYWIYNLGLSLPIGILGLSLAERKQRIIFIPFLLFFAIGNLFQLSPEMASNHKFINMFSVGLNLFVAYALYRLWKLHILHRILVVPLIVFLTLTGVIDLFPIINDSRITISDVDNNQTASYIKNNTSPKAVFLNAQFFFDPASLAGRKIYLGWPYFSWSAGYDTTKRFQKMKQILEGNNVYETCKLLTIENIDYIEIQKPTTLEEIEINYLFFNDNFTTIHNDPVNLITIYDVKTSCNKD